MNLVKLTDVVEIKKGKKPTSLGEKSSKRNIPYINIRAFEKGIISEYAESGKCVECDENDVLLVWDGARCGLSGLGIKGYVGSTLGRLRSSQLIPEYLQFFLQLNYDFLNKNNRGTGIPHISPDALGSLVLPLLDKIDQKKLTVKINALLKKVEEGNLELTSAQEKLVFLKQSILNFALRGKLVPQDPKDEPASKLLEKIQKEKEKIIAKKAPLFPEISEDEIPFDLPDSWTWARLDDVVTLKNGYAFKSDYYSKKETKHILTTPGHFYEEGGFRDQKAKTKFYKGPIPDGFILDSGDMIVVMTEQAAGLLGSAVFIPNDGFTYLHNQRLAKISSIGEVLDENYIYFYFNSPYLRENLASTCTGSTVRHTSPDRILRNLIPIPPLNEQKRIVAKIVSTINEVQTLNLVVQENLSKAKQLKQSILKKAFEGEL